ncbi:50S ribosomal protein L11 methyltransferase [Schleiferiaceae bacterium]|jgi:ribosomal protein L11 methyltransferase|nr:50S ribosomal protein L11 methyltransferase [Schleiferiaceae bacterium]PTM00739.1 MAG: 50S ribosomal protein L11 methyltransferase [Bacteroidota bacterium]MDA8769673.1 50S ribosomal protein L11 methyltransferase [Schleiferiaceae bacterium]MDA9278991.1 50S ribosomal protein L11 methyltransferase [Schleiferiaceae bacterium]MDA9908728.1 50S ribosomal protein L11 methyltransferase [Schleiferiaceae bacterium]
MASDTPIYIELAVTVSPLEPFRDLFIAQLGAVGFESFSETEEGFAAYILKEDYSASAAMEQMQWDGVTVSVKEQEIEQVNWNAEWERNFNPIEVDGRVYIRAPFHAERAGFEYAMLIEPKMSFGTGHHQTTHMMIQWLLETPSNHADVLDMGCGTGILGILAGMRGAKSVHGIDVDTWCIENTLENAQRNGVVMTADLGGSEVLSGTYDLILANINLNVLLADIAHYEKALRKGGSIFFSGFYEDNVPTLRAAAEALGLTFEGVKAREQWRSIKMVK